MTKDPGFSHLVKKGDRAMFVTGVVLVAIMGSIVHSMLSGLTPMESLLTPGATIVQAKDESPKPDKSNNESDASEAQAQAQPQPESPKMDKPKQPVQRAAGGTPSQPAPPVKPPVPPKPRGLINNVIKTADGLVEAILPIEICVKLLVATC